MNEHDQHTYDLLDELIPRDKALAHIMLIVQRFVRQARSNETFTDWTLEQIISYASEGRREIVRHKPKPAKPRVKLRLPPIGVQRAIDVELKSGVNLAAIASRLDVSIRVVKLTKDHLSDKQFKATWRRK